LELGLEFETHFNTEYPTPPHSIVSEYDEEEDNECATIKRLMIFSIDDLSSQIVVFVTIPLPLTTPLSEGNDEVGIIDDKVSLIGVNKINEFESSSPTNDFHPTHNPLSHPITTPFTPPIIN